MCIVLTENMDSPWARTVDSSRILATVSHYCDIKHTCIIYYIWFVCLSICQQKTIWPRDTRCCIFGHWVLEARIGWSLWTPAKSLATGTSTTFLDGQYQKLRQQWTLTISSLQLANELDLWEDIIITEVVGLALASTGLARELVSKLISFFDSWLIQQCAQTGCQKMLYKNFNVLEPR